MTNRKYACLIVAIAALAMGVLACGIPTPTGAPATVTPYVPTPQTPRETQPPPTADGSTGTEPPPPTEAAPTDTPAPTATPNPTVAPTKVPVGEPLVFVDQGYEIADWQPLPGKEWEGHLRLRFTGGVPPYTSSIGHRDPQADNYHYFRYSACKGASVRADMWSADGQHAFRDVWVEAPWCPTPTPNP